MSDEAPEYPAVFDGEPPYAMSYPNNEQKAVLAHLYGTLLVLAPAGTGKTRIMADRLAAVISEGMRPDKTLGVTFTNRAAEYSSPESPRMNSPVTTPSRAEAWRMKSAFSTSPAPAPSATSSSPATGTTTGTA